MRNSIENRREVPENKPEELEAVELTPKEVGMMVDQIPALREILHELEWRLAVLEGDFNASDEELAARRVEIEELKEEIEGREDAILE